MYTKCIIFSIWFKTREQADDYLNSSTWLEKVKLKYSATVSCAFAVNFGSCPLQIVETHGPTPKSYLKTITKKAFRQDVTNGRMVLRNDFKELLKEPIEHDCFINPESKETWWTPCERHQVIIRWLIAAKNYSLNPYERNGLYSLAKRLLYRCNSIFSEFAYIDILNNFYEKMSNRKKRCALLESSNILLFVYSKVDLVWLRSYCLFFLKHVFSVMGSLYLFEEYAEAFVLGRMANEILSNDEIVESMDENLITRCFLSNSFNLSNILFRLLHCESDAVFDIEFDVIEDIEIAKYSLQDVVETSESENVEIKKFSRLGKIISIPSRNEMTILPLDLPMCSIKTENVKIYLQYAGTGRTARIKSLQGLLLCNKMIRITFSRIVIRGELLSENIENILKIY